MVQIWPGTPVAAPLVVNQLDNQQVKGVRLADQEGMPGMDIHALLTVAADGPVGAVGRELDRLFGTNDGHEEWAVGSKMVIELPEGIDLAPGTVIHTIGFPEPEIFGFFYVHPDRLVSAGIFIPSWYRNPVRTSYRYLQHFIQHPYFWRWVNGGKLVSWGAKSIQESGKRREPVLAGDGFARIGEGSGSTNTLTNSGVDEAWTTGVQLARAVIELLENNLPFTKAELERTYVQHRRESWVEEGAQAAHHARNGFSRGFALGMIGMALSGFTGGKLHLPADPEPTPPPATEPALLERKAPRHDQVMDEAGWPPIPFDGQLLMSLQDALLLGGKVQAPPGFPDHVEFLDHHKCETCGVPVCFEICSAEAIHPREDSPVPAFDREKCIHCGACFWNCAQGNIAFKAGAGGLHSVMN
jgi:electron-transferring-flavoprotein dehydrogenase